MKTENELKREELIISLGFTFDKFSNRWHHKMIPDASFIFEGKDCDVFWTMNTIFESCICVGIQRQNADIRSMLGISNM